MKVAHVCNIANIAYLNVKFLRRLGLEADLYYYDFDLCLAHPEWEDADINGEFKLMDTNWRQKVVIQDYQKPDWAHIINMSPRRGRFCLKIPFASQDGSRLARFLAKWQHRINRVIPAWQQYRIIRHSFKRRKIDLPISLWESVRDFDIYRFREIVEGYDLIQAYGLEPISCLVDFPRKPCIAYEFGTMREIPFEDSLRGRLLAVAYQQADRVVVINPDVRFAAEKLGLNNYVFMPHPVGEEKFCPGPSKVREELEARYGNEVIILFAPARHDRAIKGNDRMIRAVARLMREEQRPIVLILTTVGQEVERSKELIRREGVEERVLWQPPLPKRRMAEYYRAADIVLDQFNIGTFGLTAPEAMACAKPVVMHFEPEIHEWCFPNLPPIISASTEQEIYKETAKLVHDVELREALGHKSREWFTRYHSWELIVDLHIQLYKELLSKRRPS